MFRLIEPFGGVLTAPVSSPGGASTPWYSGASVVYIPKGAASLAASYVNLANPGTNNAAPGTAPTLGAGGWVFDGATQYLTTGIVPGTAYTILMQYTAFTPGPNKTLFGVYDGATQAALVQSAGSFMKTYHEAANTPVAVDLTDGNYGFAGQTPYRDGIAEPNTCAVGTAPTSALIIGGLNLTGTPSQVVAVTVVAFVVYTTTLTAPQVLAVKTAMAAL